MLYRFRYRTVAQSISIPISPIHVSTSHATVCACVRVCAKIKLQSKPHVCVLSAFSSFSAIFFLPAHGADRSPFSHPFTLNA